ncbi:MAG TPA: FAD binding domain-containing protein [Thermoplasmata archaeon]|nr:FAD binding domain-containing protein [Thermoplasmata archaeon]
MAEFSLVAPRTVDAAIAELRSHPAHEAAVLAGGTDLLFDLDHGRDPPRTVVSLRHLPWRTLDWTGGILTVGSTLPLRSLELDPDLAARLPALAQAVRAVGGIALRARATLGGNLGRSAPASDLLPALLVLDAEVDLVGPQGDRSVPIDRFVKASRETVLGRAELIRAVRFPEPRASAYAWQRVRPVNDISQVSVAAAYSPGDHGWRVALGGVPPRAIRVADAEEPLRGARPAADQVARGADRIARHPALVGDRRASDEYRRRLASALYHRAVAAAVASGGGPP